MKTGYMVADAMTRKPVTCGRKTTLKECALIMRKHGVGSVLVLEGNKLIGILTEEDFVQKAIAEGLPLTTSVDSIMTTEIISIKPSADIFEAIKTLNEHGIRHLPVMDRGNLVGYITIRTLLKIEPQLMEMISDEIELRGIRADSPLIKSFETDEGEGVCETCGNFSTHLIDESGSMVCPNCRLN